MSKEIGFAPNLVNLVKPGKKTKTDRLGNKINFLKPDELLLQIKIKQK